MVARLSLGLAAALLIGLIGLPGTAGAAPYEANPGPAPVPSAEGPSSSAEAYNQAAIDDPYNQPDFSNAQSFGLIASQMLGAAAACEQLHSERISLGKHGMAKAAEGSIDNRAALDAAQDHMLDPAAMAQNSQKSGDADCNRLTGTFDKLQQLQMRNQSLQQDLDQPDAMSLSDSQAQEPR